LSRDASARGYGERLDMETILDALLPRRITTAA
jgi:hypothetical protein